MFARKDRQERRALRLIGSFVNDHKGLAAALMDRTGPPEGPDDMEAVEFYVAEVSFFDLVGGDRLAIAVGGQSVELARAAISAVAVHQLIRLDFPSGHLSLQIRFGGSDTPVFRYARRRAHFLPR